MVGRYEKGNVVELKYEGMKVGREERKEKKEKEISVEKKIEARTNYM